MKTLLPSVQGYSPELVRWKQRVQEEWRRKPRLRRRSAPRQQQELEAQVARQRPWLGHCWVFPVPRPLWGPWGMGRRVKRGVPRSSSQKVS